MDGKKRVIAALAATAAVACGGWVAYRMLRGKNNNGNEDNVVVKTWLDSDMAMKDVQIDRRQNGKCAPDTFGRMTCPEAWTYGGSPDDYCAWRGCAGSKPDGTCVGCPE